MEAGSCEYFRHKNCQNLLHLQADEDPQYFCLPSKKSKEIMEINQVPFLSPSLTQSKLHEFYVPLKQLSLDVFGNLITERNLHFAKPSLDTNKTCNSMEIESKTHPHNEDIRCDIELHLCKAEAAQAMMKNDLEAPKTNLSQWSIAFDFQQILSTLHNNINKTLSSRELRTYNQGIRPIKNGIMK